MENWKNLGWKENPEPYWDGTVTSRKVLRQTEDRRIVRVGMKRCNWHGIPWGNVMFCYDIEYLTPPGFIAAGEWQVESCHPSYAAAKAYLGWK